MKKFCVLLIAFLSFNLISLFAGDYILTNSGKKIDCKVTKEDGENIYFDVYTGDSWKSSFISQDEVKDYTFSGREDILKKQKKEAEKLKKKLRDQERKDSLSLVKAELLAEKQRKRDSLNSVEFLKRQEMQRLRDSIAMSKSIELDCGDHLKKASSYYVASMITAVFSAALFSATAVSGKDNSAYIFPIGLGLASITCTFKYTMELSKAGDAYKRKHK